MKFDVEEIIENDDGTATIIFDVDEEFKNNFITLMKIDEWDDEVFQKFISDGLLEYIKSKT